MKATPAYPLFNEHPTTHIILNAGNALIEALLIALPFVLIGLGLLIGLFAK